MTTTVPTAKVFMLPIVLTSCDTLPVA
jgi:hypothetical protein